MPPVGGIRISTRTASVCVDAMDEAMSRGTRTAVAAPGAVCDEAAFERHYSVKELTELWGMSDDFVRRLFLHEPGVVIFYRQQPGKRVYRTLRIPASVALRVHRRMRTV